MSTQPSVTGSTSADHGRARLQDLQLLREMMPCPPHCAQDEWDELLLLEAPSVLGLASSAAGVLDSEVDTPAGSDSSASPTSTLTTLPYSPTSDSSRCSCINIDMSDLPRVHSATPQSPAERRARLLLESGSVTGQAITDLLDLLPHSGRPIHQEPGHGYTQQPRQFTTGAYAHGPNAGLLRAVHAYPLSTLLLSRIIRSCAPDCRFSSIALTRNLMSSMHRDSFNSRHTPNILIPLSHHQHGGLWVEDAAGDTALAPNGPLGRSVLIQRPYTILWPHLRHATLPWRGNRLVLIGYHIGQISYLGNRDRARLVELGFLLEDSR